MLPWVFVGLVVGVGGVQVGQLWWESFRPKPISIKGVDVSSLPDGGYKLTVHMTVPKTKSCLRLSQHVISETPWPSGGVYQPLAATLAGGDFTQGGRLTVDLKVHPFMVQEGSVWYYTYRAAYECTRFPGFLRVSEFQSEPIAISFASNQ